MDTNLYVKSGVRTVFQIVIGLINLLIGLGFIGIIAFSEYNKMMMESSPRKYVGAEIAFAVIGFLIAFFGLRAILMGLRGIREVKVTPEGLRIIKPGSEQNLAWSQVKSYRIKHITMQYGFFWSNNSFIEIKTTEGKKIKLVWLKNLDELYAIVKEKVPLPN